MTDHAPKLERAGDVAYFVNVTGERYRIYDVLFGKPKPGKKRIVSLESSQANHRYFVPASGGTRAYRFEKAESRVLDPTRLAAQLGAAGFTAQSPLDIKTLRPT